MVFSLLIAYFIYSIQYWKGSQIILLRNYIREAQFIMGVRLSMNKPLPKHYAEKIDPIVKEIIVLANQAWPYISEFGDTILINAEKCRIIITTK